MVTRSSLELMLDKLQQLEEQPADIPPPLPVRPVSRARPARLPRPLQPSVNRSLEKTRECEERGIRKIQKWYRGHQVRCCYRELTRGVVALQSFIRGQNARRGYQQRCRLLTAIIIIQKQGRKYLEHQAAALAHLQSGDGMHPDQIKRRRAGENTKDQKGVPYTSLVDLQKRVVRAEAKLRAKKEENAALKTKLLEMEKKWQQREERMTSMEKEWQDQLTHIQECLAAAKKNRTPQIRFSNRFQNPDNIPTNSNNSDADEDDGVCIKLGPQEGLRKLRLRFKEWKKDYKNKLRDAQSTLKKLGNTHSHKNWWGRLSN
ncbi:myosin-3-like [Salvia miltiorrhiza]|uniref:myosin-3-like n=1 Tax=Salvia miltiorrhiza TaxID=226208 RepID=UPI0025ABA905|nr:myosin-3-like [Salvia miltiorrhiza]